MEDTLSTFEMPAATEPAPDDRESTVILPTESRGDDGTPPTGRGRRSLAGTTALIVLAAGAGVGGAAVYDAIHGGDGNVVSSLDTGSESDTGDSAPSSEIERVAQRMLPSVVQINVAGDGGAGSGTGIIISSDGQIITNNHVVEGAADGGTLTASFNDGSNAKAKILGRDPVTDLAVIKAEGKSGLQPAALGNSADLAVGQQVVAIGSPYGLDGTVTSGIISKLNRPVASSDASGASQTVFPAIQTDAAINPGNSGGPLVDLQGRVIGINSAIRTNGSIDSGSIGLGFAIPIDLAKNVSQQLVKGDKVQHARIGVTVGTAVSQDDITAHRRGGQGGHQGQRRGRRRPQEGRRHHQGQRHADRQLERPGRRDPQLPARPDDRAHVPARRRGEDHQGDAGVGRRQARQLRQVRPDSAGGCPIFARGVSVARPSVDG